ncbi:MAG TPA: acyl carrier protein [Bryobacteraceae bacterium]|jgi:acyl carrier protein
MSTFERIQRIIADVMQFPVEEVTPESSPDTIPTWDSIAHLNLVMAVEQEFGLSLLPEEIEQLLSVELVVALVEEKKTSACEVW